MCDCNAPEAFSEKQRKARKEHKCCECRRAILPGEGYEYVSGVWEGTAQSFKTCAPCAALRRDLTYAGCAPCFGDLAEEARNGDVPFPPLTPSQ